MMGARDRGTEVEMNRVGCRVACLLALLLSGLPEAAHAQAAPTDAAALRQDMQAVRRSVDTLVDIMKQFVAESGKRERAALLLRRLELTEQQAARLSAELQTARGVLDVSAKTIERSRSRVQSAQNMGQIDRTGAAAPLLLQEQQQAMAEEAAAQGNAAVQEQRIADLEGQLAAKKTLIRELEAALDREMPTAK